MPDDLLDLAIEEATSSPQASELMRASRRYDELRQSSAWTELREEVKARRETVIRLLGEKALKGADATRLRDEGVYARGFLDGCEALLDRPGEVEQKLEKLVSTSYEKLRHEMAQATLEQSPYG
jgi:hypothetical protein